MKTVRPSLIINIFQSLWTLLEKIVTLEEINIGDSNYGNIGSFSNWTRLIASYCTGIEVDPVCNNNNVESSIGAV